MLKKINKRNKNNNPSRISINLHYLKHYALKKCHSKSKVIHFNFQVILNKLKLKMNKFLIPTTLLAKTSTLTMANTLQLNKAHLTTATLPLNIFTQAKQSNWNRTHSLHRQVNNDDFNSIYLSKFLYLSVIPYKL